DASKGNSRTDVDKNQASARAKSRAIQWTRLMCPKAAADGPWDVRRRNDLAVLLLQGLAEDVAKAGARIGRSILGDRLLFLGNLEGLDREIGLFRTIEADHHRVELLADLEALGALFVAVAAEIGALDEAGG